METSLKWIFRQSLLIFLMLKCLVLLVVFINFSSGTDARSGEMSRTHLKQNKSPNQETVKLKRMSFFNRHFDCIVSLYYNEHRINSTLDAEGKYLENITAKFSAFGKLFIVDLHLNKNLFSGSYVQKIYNSPNIENIQIKNSWVNCYYHGRLRFHPESEAAISTCQGLSGYINDRRDTYHLEHIKGDVHRVYRNSDQRPLPFKCGTESHDPRLQAHQSVIKRHKRSIRAPYDSNRNTRYIELYLVNDYRIFERYGKMEDTVIRRSQDIANIVSSLYRQLNIYVVLVGVEVWAGGDLVSITTNPDNTMDNFLRYRKQRINPYHHNDNAQLITGLVFDNGVVGKAIKGPICTHQYSGGVNMDYGGLVNLVATTVAHEIGHNFGMEHDNDTMCECRDDRCIMAATSGQISPRKWSSCSQNALAEAFDLGMDYCIQNLPASTFQGPVCGNGFKEDGEECDCGLLQDCTNRCCNASSCMLHPLATCATGRCCDLDKCKPKAASTLCREPVSECDLAEYCDGGSEFCPEDVHLQNGYECQGGQSYCYNGHCKTQTDQCKLLWGDTGRVSDPICFQQLNMNGNGDGSCGYNWTSESYKRCDRENVMCGLLHCVHLNEKLMFWRDNLAINMRASFLSRGNKQYVCRSAMLDVGLDMPDPGFVPDGAKCEENKICINQQCVALAKLKIKQCSNNCDGHGRCNSKGNCHCHIGYAPPDCDRPGYGGSVDSGPASQEYAKKDILIALLVLFLLIAPLVILAIILILNRRRLVQWWKLLPDLKYRFSQKKEKSKSFSQPSDSNGRQARKDLIGDSHQEGHMPSNIFYMPDAPPKQKVRTRDTPNMIGAKAHEAPERPPVSKKMPPFNKSSSFVDSKTAIKKDRLSIPIQETGQPASIVPSKTSEQLMTSINNKPESTKDISYLLKPNPIVKRESLRGSEISDPILVCTTNRNSLVLADNKVDIIGPEAKLKSKSPPTHRSHIVTVKRSQSERPSKPNPPQLASMPPPPASHNQNLASATRLPAEDNKTATQSSGFRPRPVPPLPLYSNETSATGDDLLSAIQGALNDSSNLYTNLSYNVMQSPIQETAPPCPPRLFLPKRALEETGGAISGSEADRDKETSRGSAVSTPRTKGPSSLAQPNTDKQTTKAGGPSLSPVAETAVSHAVNSVFRAREQEKSGLSRSQSTAAPTVQAVPASSLKQTKSLRNSGPATATPPPVSNSKQLSASIVPKGKPAVQKTAPKKVVDDVNSAQKGPSSQIKPTRKAPGKPQPSADTPQNRDAVASGKNIGSASIHHLSAVVPGHNLEQNPNKKKAASFHVAKSAEAAVEVGGEKSSQGKNFAADKPTVAGRFKDKPFKSDASDKVTDDTKVPPRPVLPPKPGQSGKGASETSAAGQAKRVQSFRI